MSKTHLMILVIGVAGLLLLSLMMKQALKIRTEHSVHPLAADVARHFGPRLDGETRIHVAPLPPKKVSVTIQPQLGINPKRLARDVGEFIWYRLASDGIASVTVTCQDPLAAGGEQSGQKFEIARPLMEGRPSSAPLSRPARAAEPPGK